MREGVREGIQGRGGGKGCGRKIVREENCEGGKGVAEPSPRQAVRNMCLNVRERES